MRRIDRALDESGLPPLQRSAWIEVDLTQLIANAAALYGKAHPSVIAPVVKADGYGHGLEMAARCAVAGGARWLCVADAAEALRLRSDGYAGRVFVLYPVPQAMWPTMAHEEVDVTVSSLDEARAMARAPERLRVHVEIDTGMTRGGLRPETAMEAAMTVRDGAHTQLVGIWTHLSTPEDDDVTNRQLDLFGSLVQTMREGELEPECVHAAASGGLLVAELSGHDLVRPGLAFYGLDPGAGAGLPRGCAPALSVRAYPIRLATVPAGSRVGYAGTWESSTESTIATIPMGYADGWSRASSPGTSVLVHGVRAPVVGRISSDSLTVDVTGIDGVTADTEFTLLGRDADEDITADEIADVRGTISWEVLQQLGPRLSRVYLDESRPVALRAESERAIATASQGGIPGY